MCFVCEANEPAFLERTYMDHVERFTEAIAQGWIADEEFARACRRLRLDPSIALLAPLDWIVMASVEAQSVAAH